MKRFKCPACGMVLEAAADDAVQGVTCPQCGVAFIPVKRRQRPSRLAMREQMDATKWAVLAILIGAPVAWVLRAWWWQVALIVLLAVIAAGVWNLNLKRK